MDPVESYNRRYEDKNSGAERTLHDANAQLEDRIARAKEGDLIIFRRGIHEVPFNPDREIYWGDVLKTLTDQTVLAPQDNSAIDKERMLSSMALTEIIATVDSGAVAEGTSTNQPMIYEKLMTDLGGVSLQSTMNEYFYDRLAGFNLQDPQARTTFIRQILTPHVRQWHEINGDDNLLEKAPLIAQGISERLEEYFNPYDAAKLSHNILTPESAVLFGIFGDALRSVSRDDIIKSLNEKNVPLFLFQHELTKAIDQNIQRNTPH